MRWVIIGAAALGVTGLGYLGIRWWNSRQAIQRARNTNVFVRSAIRLGLGAPNPLVRVSVFQTVRDTSARASNALWGVGGGGMSAPVGTRFETSKRDVRLSDIYAAFPAPHFEVQVTDTVTIVDLEPNVRGSISDPGPPIIRDGKWEIGTRGGGNLGKTLDAVIIVGSAVATVAAGPEAGAAVAAGGAVLRGAL